MRPRTFAQGGACSKRWRSRIHIDCAIFLFDRFWVGRPNRRIASARRKKPSWGKTAVPMRFFTPNRPIISLFARPGNFRGGIRKTPVPTPRRLSCCKSLPMEETSSLLRSFLRSHSAGSSSHFAMSVLLKRGSSLILNNGSCPRSTPRQCTNLASFLILQVHLCFPCHWRWGSPVRRSLGPYFASGACPKRLPPRASGSTP
jgi:hypothetical protein